MNPIDKKLFDLYCSPILQNAENFDEVELEKAFDTFPLTKEHHVELSNLFFRGFGSLCGCVTDQGEQGGVPSRRA